MKKLDLSQKLDHIMSNHAFSHWRREDATRLIYPMEEFQFARGARIIEAGQVVDKLMFIREGTVVLEHPRGRIKVASLGEGHIIGIEALAMLSESIATQAKAKTSKRVAQKHRKREEAKIAAEIPAKILPKSVTAVIASSRVKVYQIEAIEALKYCTGGHGLKTFTLVQEKVAMQAGTATLSPSLPLPLPLSLSVSPQVSHSGNSITAMPPPSNRATDANCGILTKEWRRRQYTKVRKYQRQLEKLQASQVKHRLPLCIMRSWSSAPSPPSAQTPSVICCVRTVGKITCCSTSCKTDPWEAARTMVAGLATT